MSAITQNLKIAAPLMPEPLAVDLKEASRRCGYSVKTLRRAIEAGELAAVKATAKIVVMVEDLRRFLEGNKIVPSSSIAKHVNKKVAMTKVACGGQTRTRKTR